MEAEALAQFRDTGARWQDRRNGAPGVAEFVDRMAAFLVLVGLAGLAVGGIGVSGAVRTYLDGKVATIATLKTLGASAGTIRATYGLQIGAMTALGILLGLALGAALPLVFAPLIEARLPVPAVFGLWPGPLAQAALYGALTAAIFTLWPIARTERVRPATLYREASGRASGWPRPGWVAATLALVALLIGTAAWLTGAPRLTAWTLAGIGIAMALLAAAAAGLGWLARRAGRGPALRGRTALRLALSAIGGPRSEAVPVVLSLGLGLTVLATMGQIDTNLRAAITRDLPQVAPSYFFVDIQPDQLAPFLDRVAGDPAVTRVETAPMLRGVVTRINGVPAREAVGEHWAIQGDRGVTYTDAAPPADEIVAGQWWPADYDGPPLMSFAAEEARQMGLQIGDEITLNILGRDVTAELAVLREVEFGDLGISFLITMTPGALQGAPHTHIATVYAAPEAEAAILRDVTDAAPNVTAIRVGDAIEEVATALRNLAAATSWGAAATPVDRLRGADRGRGSRRAGARIRGRDPQDTGRP